MSLVACRNASRQNFGRSRGSLMNIDGLTQMVVKPCSHCSGRDSMACPRSATASLEGKWPRMPPTISISSGSRLAAAIAARRAWSSPACGRPSGLKPCAYRTTWPVRFRVEEKQEPWPAGGAATGDSTCDNPRYGQIRGCRGLPHSLAPLMGRPVRWPLPGWPVLHVQERQGKRRQREGRGGCRGSLWRTTPGRAGPADAGGSALSP